MIKIEHNVETQEILEIELLNNEIVEVEAVYAETKLKSDKEQIELEAKMQAKAAAEGKLAALGLTTDDLRALGL